VNESTPASPEILPETIELDEQTLDMFAGDESNTDGNFIA
jgi:hypothetical protein